MTYDRVISADAMGRAYVRAARRLKNKADNLTAAADSAGFVKLKDGRQYQVFVRLCWFDEDLLKRKPETGGLLCEERPRRKRK